MLTALRRWAGRREDEGFTLIELMVVVLIIGILLAIAIPTFLGARARANDRSAQSNLRNALTAEKILFVDTQSFTASTAGAGIISLTKVESSLGWSTAVSATDPHVVVATLGSLPSTLVLAVKSLTGTCFYIGDVASPGTNPGIYYAASSGCATPGDPSATANPPARADPATGAWASAF